jgi:hypothetical protein
MNCHPNILPSERGTMKPVGLYMFIGPGVDPGTHKAEIETPEFTMLIQGVGSVEEGASMARQFVDEGVSIVELCGAFGYAGAKAVSDAVGEKAQVSMTVSEITAAPKLAKILDDWL